MPLSPEAGSSSGPKKRNARICQYCLLADCKAGTGVLSFCARWQMHQATSHRFDPVGRIRNGKGKDPSGQDLKSIKWNTRPRGHKHKDHPDNPRNKHLPAEERARMRLEINAFNDLVAVKRKAHMEALGSKSEVLGSAMKKSKLG